VVIEQGRPGGFLIWQPTVVEETGVQRDELRPVAVDRVEEELDLSSLAEAQELVDNLERSSGGSDDEPDRTTTPTTEKPGGTTTTERPTGGATAN
jgi:hypothetical protein